MGQARCRVGRDLRVGLVGQRVEAGQVQHDAVLAVLQPDFGLAQGVVTRHAVDQGTGHGAYCRREQDLVRPGPSAAAVPGKDCEGFRHAIVGAQRVGHVIVVVVDRETRAKSTGSWRCKKWRIVTHVVRVVQQRIYILVVTGSVAKVGNLAVAAALRVAQNPVWALSRQGDGTTIGIYLCAR